MSVEPRTHSACTEIGFTDWQVRIGVLLDGKIRLSAPKLFYTISSADLSIARVFVHRRAR